MKLENWEGLDNYVNDNFCDYLIVFRYVLPAVRIKT